MLALFLNPGFLFIALALVSVPIIIHLINRMRYKRIRWAAMEFLLKAQKRTRRRLIIEQLLLLALRCLLIALVGLLVSRFVGCSDSSLGGKPNLHVAVLDDTLSMQDQWKQSDGTFKNCFDVAKNDVLIKKIAKGLSQAKTNERLVILPLSKINDPDFQPKIYEGLNNPDRLKEVMQDIADMQPSMVHVNMLQGLKAAQKQMTTNADSRVTLHILSDFRHKDWGLPGGEGLTKELLDLVKRHNDIKIRPIDTVYPPRAASQGGYPPSRDNVGIIDVRPSTRIIGKNMPVQFNIALKNFSGKEVEVKLTAINEVTGKEMQDVDFVLQDPKPNEDKTRVRLAPNTVTNVGFEYRFNPDIKAGESHYAHISIHLTNNQRQPLDNDGLLPDNVRHAFVEVREKVPVLVIDGDPKGRDEGNDSYFVDRALYSVPGRSYDVTFGDQLAGGYPAKALERPDLNRFPTIMLLNVRDLTAKQLTNLENYVKEGGGLAVFLGPLVNASYYNKSLYKNGKGLFPAPLKEIYFPSPNEELLPETNGETFQVLTRDELFANGRSVPIFGEMFPEPIHREPLRYVTIRRYFQVARSQWKLEPGRVFELATLPNNAPTAAFEQTVADITLGATVKDILANAELKAYRTRLEQHLREIEKRVRAGNDFKAFHLANQIELLLTDKGSVKNKDQFPDMTEFWASPNDKVQLLKRELTNLRDQVTYGDPFVVAQNFGKGKVVAVMSTAGKEWNNWAGGNAASGLFMTFVWEMQNYLSSQGSEANLTVGTNIDLVVDAEQFKGAQLKMVRHFVKPQVEKPAEREKVGEQFGREDNGQIVFTMTKNLQPGLYISELVDENAPGKAPLTVLAHAFNVDTASEGDLNRVGSEELDRELISRSNGQIKLVTVGSPDDALLGKFNDFSESPWLFLILLLVLVAEQALAVHLSFHMKANENAMLPAGAKAA